LGISIWIYSEIDDLKKGMALFSVFDKFVRSFDDMLKLMSADISDEAGKYRISEPFSLEELARIIQKEKPNLTKVNASVDFKLWHIPASKLGEGVLDAGKFVDEYSWDEFSAGCYAVAEEEYGITDLSFSGRPLSLFLKYPEAGVVNPKAKDNCSRLVNISKSIIETINPARLAIDVEAGGQFDYDYKFPDYPSKEWWNPTNWWFFVYYRDPYDFVRLTLRVASGKLEEINEKVITRAKEKYSPSELFEIIKKHSLEAFTSSHGGIGARFGETVDTKTNASKELLDALY